MIRDDRTLYRWVYVAIEAGLVLSIALLVLGVVANLISDRVLPQVSLQFGEALRAAARLDGEGLASLGILSLMLTPAAVVAVACIAGLKERDWRTTATAAIVFAIMLLGATIGQ